MRTFYIAQILSSDLMSRPLARDFYDYIKNTEETDVVIDFSGVNFATRSFMDEFYNIFIKPSDLPFKVSVVNMPSDVETTLSAVQTTQNKKKTMLSAKVVKAKTLKDVDNCFMSLSI